MNLFRIVYYSKNQAAKFQKTVTKDIRSIFESGSRNNPPMGITGALIFNDQYFAQILEGDRVITSKMFCRIAHDPRHAELVLMQAVPIEQRMFLDWSMAYAGHSDAIDQIYLKHSVIMGFAPARMSAGALSHLITDLVDSNARVAHASVMATSSAHISKAAPVGRKA